MVLFSFSKRRSPICTEITADLLIDFETYIWGSGGRELLITFRWNNECAHCNTYKKLPSHWWHMLKLNSKAWGKIVQKDSSPNALAACIVVSVPECPINPLEHILHTLSECRKLWSSLFNFVEKCSHHSTENLLTGHLLTARSKLTGHLDHSPLLETFLFSCRFLIKKNFFSLGPSLATPCWLLSRAPSLLLSPKCWQSWVPCFALLLYKVFPGNFINDLDLRCSIYADSSQSSAPVQASLWRPQYMCSLRCLPDGST